MKLIFVRHGETINNKEKIIQDTLEGKLNEEGTSQAKKLAERLSKEKIDLIYCSDSERAKETLKEIIRFFPTIPVYYTEKLREKNPGYFKGFNWNDWRNEEKESKQRFANFKPLGGESIMEMIGRINSFLNETFKKHKNENILWVTHGGVNKSIKHIVEEGLNEPTRKEGYEQENCCVNILKYEEKIKNVELWNCTRHLINLKSTRPKTL